MGVVCVVCDAFGELHSLTWNKPIKKFSDFTFEINSKRYHFSTNLPNQIKPDSSNDDF